MEAQRDQFATTRWSLVDQAGQKDSLKSRAALAELCQRYWYPLYAFARRQGYSSPDAQDLTQAFFARLVEKRDLADVDREKGRFRSFLLASLKHFLMNERDKAQAQKRGGGKPLLALDFQSAESRYALEPSHDQTAERIFDREWAHVVLEQVHDRLAREQESQGKLEHLRQLRSYLTGTPATRPYRVTGEILGWSEGAVRTQVHRLRRRYGQLLREQIAETVAGEAEIDDEIRRLFTALQAD